MDMIIMGQRIRAARKFRNMAVKPLAAKIGISSESLSHIECGSRKTSLQTLLAIADVLDVSLDYLSGRTASPSGTRLKANIDDQELSTTQMEMLLDLSKHLIPFVKQYD